MTPLILIEFNELSPRLLERFMAAGQLPNFQTFYAVSSIYVTVNADRPCGSRSFLGAEAGLHARFPSARATRSSSDDVIGTDHARP